MFTAAAIKEMWVNSWPIISILLMGSVISGAIMLERWFSLRRFDFDRDGLLEKLRKLLAENKKESAVTHCQSLKAPVGRILGYLISPSAQDRAAGRAHLERLAVRLVRTETARMTHYVTALGTIASIAPYVGLFGTVMGIIRAFRAISESQGGGAAVVAVGIAEALVGTALGPFVAIPAIVGYNGYVRKIERISEDMELCAEEIIDLTGPKGSPMASGLMRKGRRAPIAEINMIPLIDVSLVLLIIFMVMTPYLVQQQIRINLPKSVTGTDAADRPITITIQREGAMSLNGRAVSVATIEKDLGALLSAEPDRPVVIQADKDIALQRVVSVMDVAKRLRVARLGISVETPK